MFVGGENFGLITFNDEGDYERYRSNTSCAAGTGGFIEEQAVKRGVSLSGYADRALVAVLEHRLKKPVFVSRFCHLTGALGSALILAENGLQRSGFRGLALCREEMPVENEVCEICHNHCKICKVIVQGETVVFGFLWGRDYETKGMSVRPGENTIFWMCAGRCFGP